MIDLSNPIIALIGVFFAGLITSANPCSLAAIPIIIGFIGGYSKGDHKKALLFSLFFSIGLAATFTILGAIAAFAGTLLGDIGGYWKYILGIVAIAIGIQMFDVCFCKIPKPNLFKKLSFGLLGAFLAGLLFGVAISPCSTPILAFLLTFVASKQNVAYGISLLFVYALAHTIFIFVLGISTGLIESFMKSTKFQDISIWLNRISGLIFIIVGLLFILL